MPDINKPKAKQTCTRCAHVAKCWPTHTNKGNPISTQNIIINILVCRLQLGIDRDAAVKNLLHILRPGMIRLISYEKQITSMPGIDTDQLLSDMQSMAIEYLIRDYKIGDRGRATPYLFDPQQGFLTKWLKWTLGKNRRFYSHHELYAGNGEDNCQYEDDEEYHQFQWNLQGEQSSWDLILEGAGSLHYDPYNSTDDDVSSTSQCLMSIIEDGVTLNSNEFRVIKFCLVNSNETNNTRHIDGLHIYLAKLMGVSRPRITRLYKRSKEKLHKRYIQINKKNKGNSNE